MLLEESIHSVFSHVSKFIDEVVAAGNAPQISSLPINTEPSTDAQYLDSFEQLKRVLDADILGSSISGFSVEVGEELAEDTKSSISAFNASVDQQSREFALLMGFNKYCDSILHKIRKLSTDHSEKTIKFPDVALSAEMTSFLEKLCLVLDLLMSLADGKKYVSLHSNFFSVLQNISDSLASFSIDCIGAFWYFVEARAERLKDTVFNPEVASNRIAVLSLCNSLTDKFYSRDDEGKLDSYAKDSFNDIFQARVRVFLAGLLNVDDSTGLNKYFMTANRVNREPALRNVKSGDDQLLEDVLEFYKLLRDPYTFLRNPRQLAKQGESLLKMHSYLLDEEMKYSKRHPPRDNFAVPQPLSEHKKEQITKKYADTEFFPEQYWLSPFEDSKLGQQFEDVHAEDQRRALKRFDSSKFRKLLILQIYLVSCCFVELDETNKREMLTRIDALPTTKHITEDSTSAALVARFLKIKRETIRLVKTWDPQWSFLLQQLMLSEEYWWELLIYGKSKDGKPLLASRTLSDADLAAVKEKFETLFPEKTKRYFNTHATPQLSRKFKTKTGLSLLKSGATKPIDYKQEIARLTQEIENEEDKARRADLAEERTVLVWKQTRALREKQWHSLDKHLAMEDLENEEEEEKEEKEEALANANANGSKAEKETSSSETTSTVNGTLNTPDAGGQSVGEIAGDQVAETRVLQNSTSEKSVGEAAGESVAANRKRDRSPEHDNEEAMENGATPTKKGKPSAETD